MKWILVIVILCSCAFAGDRSFWRDNRIPISVDAGMRVADTAITCYTVSHGWHEDLVPSQRCGVVAAWSAGSWGVATGISYLLHRKGHYRLSRWVPLVDASFPAYGMGVTAYSATQPRRKPMFITASWSFSQPTLTARPIRLKGQK